MLDLLFLLVLAVWSAGVGARILRRFGTWDAPASDHLAVAIPLGLGMLALAGLGLGELGVLDRIGLTVVLVAGAVFGGRSALQLVGRSAREVANLLSRRLRPRSIHPPPQPSPTRGEGARFKPSPLVGEGWVGGLGTIRRAFLQSIANPSVRRGPGHLTPESRGIPAGPAVPADFDVAGPPTRPGASTRGTVGPSDPAGVELGRHSRPYDPVPLTPRTGVRSVAELALGLAAAATVAGTLLTALAPVTDGDALCYHLQVPKVFLAHRGVWFDPDLHETVYPLATEMLYAAALGFRGPVACRLIQWMLGLAFAANVTALARPSLGHRAWWAGTLALLVPAVSNGMSAPLNDVALAAFGAAALTAWSRHLDRPAAGTAVLTGLLAGLAMGVKYPALVLTGIIGLTIANPFAHRASFTRGFPRVRHASLFAVTALLVGGGWYLRAWVHTGNPVYPFFRHVFDGAGLDEVLDPIKRPMTVSPWSLLTALVPMTLEPDRFDSFSHQFGPIFLLFLPALLLEKAPRRVLGIAAIGHAFLALCLTQRQSMRFVLIAVGPLSVAAAWAAATWADRRSVPARLLVATLVLVLGFETGLALVRSRHGLDVVLGRESPAHFLARREPTYRVGRWVGDHLPSDARLIGQDHRGFYFPRDYTMELAHRRRTGLGGRGESAEAVVARLIDEGFTHVLFCPPVPETAVEFDPTLGRLLAPWVAGRDPLYREQIRDGDGVKRRYAIYRLTDVTTARDDARVRR